MQREQPDRYSIAWVKLAECILRREKERAFGVYSLLSHSFDNLAVRLQLEGDILLAFEDQLGAARVYEKAAQRYCEQKKFVQATAIYNHLFTMSGSQEYVDKILLLYVEFNQPAEILIYMRHLCLLMLRRYELDQVIQLLDRINWEGDQRTEFITEMTCLAVVDHLMPSAMKTKVVHAALDLVMHDVQLLSVFFSKIKAIDPHYYHEACAYVESTP